MEAPSEEHKILAKILIEYITLRKVVTDKDIVLFVPNYAVKHHGIVRMPFVWKRFWEKFKDNSLLQEYNMILLSYQSLTKMTTWQLHYTQKLPGKDIQNAEISTGLLKLAN
jgi:hypothetical protein